MRNIYVLLIGLMFIACPDKKDDTDSTIRGYVLDNDGSPKSDVKIVYNIKMAELILWKSNNEESQFRVQYSLEDSSNVLLWIEDDCNGDTIKILVNELQPPGLHSIIWDQKDKAGKFLTENMYFIKIKTEFDEVSNRFVYEMNYTENDYSDINAKAITNSDGYFEFNQDCLPFDFEETAKDSSGNEIVLFTVPRIITVWAIDSNNEKVRSDTLMVDSEKGLYVTLHY